MERYSHRLQGIVSYKTLSAAIATSITLSHAPASFAQENSSFAIEEVVVSARKTQESSQDVPIAVSAFSADGMKSLNVTNVKDFEGIVPGLNMGGGGNGLKGDSNPYIRGVGQRETKVTIDTAVGTYVDGIYIGRAAGALLDAVDVQSIEVLRGPQGTLFGKNTTGGAIVITTQKPGPELGGNADVRYGNLGRRDGSLSLNMPLIDDTLYSRLTLSGTKNDGYTENQIDGRNWSDDDRMMAIGQLRWEADSVVTDLFLSATKTRQAPRGQKCLSFAEEYEALGGQPPLLEGFYNTFLGPDAVQNACRKSMDELDIDEFESEQASTTIFGNGHYDVDTAMAGLTVDWDLSDELRIKSITAWRETEQRADEDLDGTALGVTGRFQPYFNATNQYSQEFQFLGNAMDGRLRYVTGLYAFLEKTDDDALQDYAGFASKEDAGRAGLMLAQSKWTVRETENEAWSAFSQLYFDVTEYVELTVGLRYTDETRETNYMEGDVYVPSMYTAPGSTTNCDNNTLALGIGCSVNYDPVGGFALNPFRDWLYGSDSNGDRIIEAGDVGNYARDSGERADDAWTPMVSLSYTAHEDVLETLRLDDAMVFVTYSEGFRSGGVTEANGDFDGNGIKDIENFTPEYVNNYEVGLKLDGLDRRIRANFAAFYMDYEDIQVTTVIAEERLGLPLPAIENAGKSEIKGVEGEFTFLATENLRFMLNFAYTDADYTEWTVDGTVLGETVTDLDRSDEPMPRVADWTAFFGVDYVFNTDDFGTITPSINARYSTEVYAGFDRDSYLMALAGGDLIQPEVTFWGANIRWDLPDERTTVTLWGKNLTNEDDYLAGGVPLVSVARTSGAIYAEPMTYGIDLSYRFGE